MLENLRKRVIEKPAELKRHQDYAKALSDAGDPRGELIETQIALENQSLTRERRFELERQERRLLSEHGRQWLGGLAEFVLMKDSGTSKFQTKPGYTLWFWRGWLEGLQLDELNLKVATVLLKSPEMTFVRRLILTEALNASCDYLHEWGLLDKIKELDLSYGRITDKGALVLAGDKSIKKLEMLDLTGNQITEVGIAAITKAFPKVLHDDQNPLQIIRGVFASGDDADSDGDIDSEVE